MQWNERDVFECNNFCRVIENNLMNPSKKKIGDCLDDWSFRLGESNIAPVVRKERRNIRRARIHAVAIVEKRQSCFI